LRLVKSCVLRPLDRRQASGHTLRCVRYEPTVIYIDMRHAIITDLASPDLARTVRFCKFMHACMLVSPARRRSGLDSTGRGVAPAALVNVVRSGRQPIGFVSTHKDLACEIANTARKNAVMGSPLRPYQVFEQIRKFCELTFALYEPQFHQYQRERLLTYFYLPQPGNERCSEIHVYDI
jgi:hypothetical protein